MVVLLVPTLPVVHQLGVEMNTPDDLNTEGCVLVMYCVAFAIILAAVIGLTALWHLVFK